MSDNGRGVLLTGASGYLGGLIATALLLNDSTVRILAPLREGHDPNAICSVLAAELSVAGATDPQTMLDRIEFVTLAALDSLEYLDDAVSRFGVDDIIHCAACLDYFDKEALYAVNVGFTQAVLSLGRRANVDRFIYISTAFSCGYVESRIAETLHREPVSDPTDYTATKRTAEQKVAESGLPYQILRPSIVIGHSADGRYSGKRYGLYQLWSGIERLLCRQWHETIHAFAPDERVNLIHQDAFQAAFVGAFQGQHTNQILNIVSGENGPTVRDLWRLWLEKCNKPRETIFYDKMIDIPRRDIPPPQRALLALASVNLEIISHPWRFSRDGIDQMIEDGLAFPEVSLDSVEICQTRVIENSTAIQKFLKKHQTELVS